MTRTADVSELIGTLAESGQAQSISIHQVNSVVTDLDAITQQNAALVEETSAASRSLSMEANRLATLVSRFNVGNHRRSTAAEIADPPPASSRPEWKSLPVQGNAAIAVSDQDWQEF